MSRARFSVKRQKGSHIILCRDEPFAEVVIPNHKTLDEGTLRTIIRQVELEVDEFIKQLKCDHRLILFESAIAVYEMRMRSLIV